MAGTLLLSKRVARLGVALALSACASQRGDDQATAAAVNDLLKEYSASLNSGEIRHEELRAAGDWAFIRGTGSWKFHRDIFNSNVASK